jgi:serine/threonine protein kinase
MYFEEILKERGYFDENKADNKAEYAVQKNYLNHNNKFKDFYNMGDMLGIGRQSVTRKCTNISSKITRAVKIIDKSNMEQDGRLKILHEIEMLTELDHPNICRIIEIFEDETKVQFVMELLTGGVLFD